MTKGLFLGKFMPPHNGHLHVCDVALQHVDHLTVLMCSHDAEPIDGHLRAAWMRACLDRKGYSVVHMHRDIPQEPGDHPDFWQIWQDAICAHHPDPIDVVFGSETYVYQLAQVLNAKPHVVDLNRRSVPVSGTKIRKNPAQYWDHIPQPVRTYFQKRITLIGAESTGKSTLASQLADEFETKLIPEYGRTYDAAFKAGKNWDHSDFLKIADGHLSQASVIAPLAGPIVVEDTDVLQTVVWSEALIYGASPALIQRLRDATLPGLYLLLDPKMAWVDDGTRYHSDQHERETFHARLKHWLDALGATWVEIDGASWDARHAGAKRAISNAFAIPGAPDL